MKKLVLAMLVMTLVCTGVFATSLEPGIYEGSADIRASLYRNDTPLVFGDVQQGDETRAIFKVDGLDFGKLALDPAGVPKVETVSGAPYDQDHLAGMLYDVTVDTTTAITGGSAISYVAGNRYANEWVDTYAGENSLLVDDSNGAGGLLVIYDDPNTNTQLNGNPASWVEDGSVTSDGSITTGILDDYPTVSDDAGEPWLIAVLMPLPAATANFWGLAANTVLYEQVTVFGGYAIAFANIIGGTAAQQFDTDLFGTGLDIRIEFGQFGINTTNPNTWALTAQDPIQFGIIPEPASLTLLGLGVAGLIGYRRKRK